MRSVRSCSIVRAMVSALVIEFGVSSSFGYELSFVNVLRAEGAQDIERADGTWQAGQWIDFDPLKPPLLVDLPSPEDVQLRK